MHCTEFVASARDTCANHLVWTYLRNDCGNHRDGALPWQNRQLFLAIFCTLKLLSAVRGGRRDRWQRNCTHTANRPHASTAPASSWLVQSLSQARNRMMFLVLRRVFLFKQFYLKAKMWWRAKHFVRLSMRMRRYGWLKKQLRQLILSLYFKFHQWYSLWCVDVFFGGLWRGCVFGPFQSTKVLRSVHLTE